MEIYKSLDFVSAGNRIEENTPGDYIVHLEDYESLNDLIARSIRTKTKFVPEASENAEYDDDKYIDDVIGSYDPDITDIINQKPAEDVKAGSEAGESERSEATEASTPAPSDPQVLP